MEFKEERASMREGYDFLDEKRLMLAAKILEELGCYELEMEGFREDHVRAARALRGAVARHGLEGLELYPKATLPCEDMKLERRSVLGVTVQSPAWDTGKPQLSTPTVNASPEAEECRDAFLDILLRAARLAVLAGNLERLRLEYNRTARRARALEDVLLPEINDTIRVIGTALEELEREEVIRVRQFRSAP